MSKLRDEEAKKRKAQEENDILLEIGKEGKEGDKLFREHQKAVEKEAQIKEDILKEQIDDKKRTRGYHKFLCDLLTERLRTIVFPVGWTHLEAPTEKGVVMELKNPDGRIFRQAFAPAKDPLYDLSAIDTFALRVENTINNPKEHNGIWTPH